MGYKSSAKMKTEDILDELLSLLESWQVQIRRESLGGRGGGLCEVRGEKIFFVDTESGEMESAVLCAEVVAELGDIENIYIKPEVREFINRNSRSGLTDKGVI